ncbi:unnamed protein product [Leptidea sinapis]|uniref:Farnesoic acid O-methyl transferase domain-containing protein n=1 Tax=Leptidea sinapis TaxID=189913 RepID=A0A5E4QCV5_9NEOP|nr:unnamed protein product [Leptidea sinapis]
MANILDVATPNNLEYQFFPVSSGSVQFKVRAPHDAHIALTMGPQELDPMYEIFIGGWGNTKSVIRRNRTKPDKVEINTPEILNGGEFRGFWVRWDSGVVSAGREGESIPFISWADPDPFPISFVGVCTGWGASGTWKIEDGAEFDTVDKLEYKFGPVAAGSLEFDFLGPHNCHICLAPAPAEVDPIYEIILGGWENSKSVIRHCRQKPDKVTVPTPGIMNANEPKKFLIEWRCGTIAVRDGKTGQVLMEWTDPAPFPITHFGIRTGWGAQGQWRIVHFYKAGEQQPLQPPPAAAPLYNNPPGYPSAPPMGGGGADGEPLFIGRVRHEGSITTGKVQQSHGVCYISFAGQELGFPDYEILMS